jgi:hypothetical protein
MSEGGTNDITQCNVGVIPVNVAVQVFFLAMTTYGNIIWKTINGIGSEAHPDFSGKN